MKLHAGLGEVTKGVKDSDVGTGVFGEFVSEGRGIEIEKQRIHTCYGDAEASLINEVGVGLFEEGGSEIESGAHFMEVCLVAEPILKAAGVPAGEIGLIELMAKASEGLDNRGVREAIMEHPVKALTALSGEPGDLRVAADRGGTAGVGFGSAGSWCGTFRGHEEVEVSG